MTDLPDGLFGEFGVQSFSEKYSTSPLGRHSFIDLLSRLARGAYRDRHGRWVRDAVDAAASGALANRRADERRFRGRRSRVVLAPRRWRQAGDDASHHTGDGGNKARSPGRARNKPLKPLRRECRMRPVNLW
jgi:hypothetical protein